MIKAADLFCGAGGTSIGAHQTGEVDVAFALNHWERAIETHSANFPGTKHVESALKWTHPSECPKINLLFASPECTHHSRARGGRPTSNQQRSGAWEIMPWIEYHRPSTIVVENVVEFEEWGPVGRNGKPLKSMKGHFFQAWIAAIQSAGYRVDFQRLNAADFGSATSRNRLFVVAKKGRRQFQWPEPTHQKSSEGMLPGMEVDQWRGAIEIIDWSIPLPSVFGRKRGPLADKTLARIEKGLIRHVEPFVVKLRTHGSDYQLTEPIGTITAGGLHHGLSVPFIATVNHGDSGGTRTRANNRPLPTVTTSIGEAIVAPMIVQFDNQSNQSVPRYSTEPIRTVTTKNGQAVAVPFMVPRHGERPRQQPRSHSSSDPLPTIACSNSASLAVPIVMAPQSGGACKGANEPVPTITTMAGSQLFVPFLASFYGTKNDSASGQPVPTITTVDRHALAAAALNGYRHAEPRTDAERSLAETMTRLGVADIGFRMLSNPELASAQGFPLDYQFCGTKKEVTKQIGNSVSPDVAQALTEAILG